MPSTFIRPKKKPQEVNASTESGLIPQAEVIPPRRPFASKSLRLSLEGRVSTRRGLFAQVLDREAPTDIWVDGTSPPTVTVADEGLVDEMDRWDDDAADVLAGKARAEKKNGNGENGARMSSLPSCSLIWLCYVRHRGFGMLTQNARLTVALGVRGAVCSM